MSLLASFWVLPSGLSQPPLHCQEIRQWFTESTAKQSLDIHPAMGRGAICLAEAEIGLYKTVLFRALFLLPQKPTWIMFFCLDLLDKFKRKDKYSEWYAFNHTTAFFFQIIWPWTGCKADMIEMPLGVIGIILSSCANHDRTGRL